jgi:hypothetical protein
MNSILFNQTGLSGAVTGTTHAIRRLRGETHAALQVTITGTATAVVEGRLGPAEAWFTLDTFAVSRMVLIGIVPQIRVRVVSATTGATVRAVMDACISAAV